VCANCHNGEIDSKPHEWPQERILELKAKHEERIASSSDEITTISGTISVRNVEGDDVAAGRIRRPTRIAPGTPFEVENVRARRVTGLEIGEGDGQRR
jgi:hypothetical protein